MDTKAVSDYYDDFADVQQETGINDRIFGLYRRLLRLGLKSDSRVLELGCGIGTLTYLLSRTVKSGQIEAVDISPRSIAFCREKIKGANIRFEAGDVVDFAPVLTGIDFITLMDVLEHIPVERHEKLFDNLSERCGLQTRVVINIPNPDYILYDRVHHPEVLQVIDQPLPLPGILQSLERSNLELVFFETYSIWVENDYQFLVLKKKEPFEEKFLQHRRNLLQKAVKKLERLYIKVRYHYP